MFRRKAGTRAEAIRGFLKRNGFGGILVAALLPPPTPFKIFVLAAGVFELPLASFASAIALARAFRYFGIGYLAVKYGSQALPYVEEHKVLVVCVLIALVAVSYGLSRLLLREAPPAAGSGK